MKTHKLFLILFFLILPFKTFCQGFQITPPKLEFDGRQLLISYDVVNNNQADQFYVWVEMVKDFETFWGAKKNHYTIVITALEKDIHSYWFTNNNLTKRL